MRSPLPAGRGEGGVSGGPAAVWGPWGTLRSPARKMRSLDRGHPDTYEVRSSAFQPRTWEEPQKDPETEKSRTRAAPPLPMPSAGRPRSGDWLQVGRHMGTELGLSAKPRKRMAWAREARDRLRPDLRRLGRAPAFERSRCQMALPSRAKPGAR